MDRCRRGQTGQALVLLVLLMTLMLAMLAFALDVSRAYSLQRFERSIADAAALAGAQDLQDLNSRTVTNPDRQRARTHALATLTSALGATGAATDPACNVASDIVDCPIPGTDYLVSVKTPSPTCVHCDPDHAVQVAVRIPSLELTVAGFFGQGRWNVPGTSVAGLTFRSKYAIQTLRPPNILHNGLDQNRNDLETNGTNTRITVLRGDVGTNTTVQTNSSSMVVVSPGYFIYHIDDIVPDPWNKDLAGNPHGKLIHKLLRDPAYQVPSRDGLPTFSLMADGVDAGCALVLDPSVVPAGARCFRPGIYAAEFRDGSANPVSYLEPGVYFFDHGLDISYSLYGGVEAAQPGVALVIPQDRTYAANNADVLQLNFGPSTCASDSCRAAPAVDAVGRVQTTEGLPLTLIVPRDQACFSGTLPQLCSDNQNDAIRIPGNAQVRVGGVVYAPSDRVQVNGDLTDTVGTIGQIIAWTVTYSGGAHLNQEYPGGEERGVLRLDGACSAGTVCNSPY
jgi:hypothetical protein